MAYKKKNTIINKIKTLSIILTILFAFSGCKKKEELKASYTASGRVYITDKQYWPQGQKIMFGVFIPEKRQPELSVELMNPTDSTIVFSLAHIPEGEYEFKIFVYENTIYKTDLIVYDNTSLHQDIVLADKNLTLVNFTRIQKQVFNNCLQCHGGASGQPAAGMYLLPDSSYKYLVNVNAVNSFLFRVKPVFADSSFIIKVLNNDNISFDHLGKNIATTEDIKLINDWINTGAINN